MRFHRIIAVLLFPILVGCSADEGSGVEKPLVPRAAILQLPPDGETCEPGTVTDESYSEVYFKWGETVNTDNYTLHVVDQLTWDELIFTTGDPELVVVLKRGNPYRWYVESKNQSYQGSAKSETWAFYTRGVQVENYAPFPAELIHSSMGEVITGTESYMQWQGQDVETASDQLQFTVYMGLEEAPGLLQTNVSNTYLEVNDLVQDTVYYWKVETTDGHGNTSESVTYQFRTQ